MKFVFTTLIALVVGLVTFVQRAQAQVPSAAHRQRRNQLVKEKLVSEKKRYLGDKRKLGNVFHKQGDSGEENTPLQEDRTLIVECSHAPRFKCSSAVCDKKLKEEQETVWGNILELYPDATLVSSTRRLVNALYVQLSPTKNEDETSQMEAALKKLHEIDRVSSVTLHGSLEMDVFAAVDYVGGFRAQEEFCASGEGVRVAVLDGGVDYTHWYLGGEGTLEAYEDAYGRGSSSSENRQRDGLFPTEVVVDGYDFIGEFSTIPVQDSDPIDSFGHGTAVSHAILTVAPGAKLVGLKVCSESMACPVFSIIQGLEYALDPNGDGDLEDSVDIINLSLGIPFVSPFYNFVASALEAVFELGVLPVTSAGNSGNFPYIMGGLSGSPNSISVGATGHPNDSLDRGVIANYSSRGPGENNMMKPDIVAPSGLALAAAGTGVYRYRDIKGTSFSAPLVAGAAALVMERCPGCSPFAIKSLLLNNAHRGTRYRNSTTELSPITLSGAGELRVDKALRADFWAYSVQDVQPSISLGLINADKDIVVRRTIKVTSLSESPLVLRVNHLFRNPQKEYSDALTISFNTTRLTLPGGCNSEAYVEAVFRIDASLAPPNRMTSTGAAGFNPRKLDLHEYGGHIVLRAEDTVPFKDISLPFVGIIRQASDVSLGTAVLRDLSSSGATDVPVSISNNGAGKAQVDAFQLLLVSGDDAESSFGEPIVPNDFRYIGYRVLNVGRPDCTHLVEFSFTTWERKNGRLVTHIYGVEIDLDGDNEPDRFLFNSGLALECYVADYSSGRTRCTGMPPDHGTSSTNTVLRACSEDLGIEDSSGQLGVRFDAATFSHEGEVYITDSSTSEGTFITVDFPRPSLSAPSYDIRPGDTLQTIQVEGKNVQTAGDGPFGLVLLTNAYRDANNTGAATPNSESLILLREGYNFARLPREITPDILEFPVAQDLTGPECSAWNNIESSCSATTAIGPSDGSDPGELEAGTLESPIEEGDSMLDPIVPMLAGLRQQQGPQGGAGSPTCPPVPVPRAEVPTISPEVASATAPVTASPLPNSLVIAASGINGQQQQQEASSPADNNNGGDNERLSIPDVTQHSQAKSGFHPAVAWSCLLFTVMILVGIGQ